MKQIETDVAVIAGGTSGLSAALSAAENGAKVAVFERASTTGGTGNMALGIFAVESRLQRERQIDLSRERAFREFMDYTHWRVDARLVKTFIDMSADTINWLEKLGVEFAQPDAYFRGSYFTQHTLKFHGMTGTTSASSMVKTLMDKARSLGTEFYLRTTVKKIVKTGGMITGLIAEEDSGEALQVSARAVIVATGGFGDNPEMIRKYTGYEYGKDLFPVSARNMVGDGIRMAWEVGAGQGPMNMEIIYLVPETDPLREVTAAMRQPNLIVNLAGERFFNEEISGNTTFTGNAISLQKNRCAFNIFDDGIKQYYMENGFDVLRGGLYPKHLEEEFRQAIDSGHKYLFIADSLEELAAKTGIDINGLKATIAEYNHACETGKDTLFNKNPRYLRPIKQPKYFAGKIFPSAYGSLGGIKINYRTEVLTKDFDVIPGLYAVGVDANAIYGDSYVIIMPGNTMSFAINSGRIAGKNAALYIKK